MKRIVYSTAALAAADSVCVLGDASPEGSCVHVHVILCMICQGTDALFPSDSVDQAAWLAIAWCTACQLCTCSRLQL